MLLNVILLLSVGITYGYNIDVDFPIIYSDGDVVKDSYFGYTVHLYQEPIKDISWLIVGAPRGNYSWPVAKKLSHLIEPGVAYRCPIKGEKCQEIKPQNVEDEEGHIAQFELKTIISKQRGWFGSAMSIDESNEILTVCAPRIIVNIFNPDSRSQLNFDTMQGMCYSGNVFSNTLLIEDINLDYHDFKTRFWYNPLHGFSVHYASTKENHKEKEINRIVGEPEHESYGTVDILYSNKRMTVELPSSSELSKFGYSVASGYFFKRDQLLFASGAPSWRYVGLVGIINPASNVSLVAKLHGNHIGEFFGASLAVGDLNNDGLDDLLVGAPYWGEDNGRVYIYFSTSKGQFELASILQGAIEGSHFGYTIVSGDLDYDGFYDIIVGAPWEENGVIYIYNGGSDLMDTNLQASERIEVAKLRQLNSVQKIQRFGFSISKPVDIDANGYLDIAVGAYKSGHVVVLRSKPVVKTELVIQTIPNTLQRDAKQFLLRICPKYTGYNMRDVQEFKITVTIDVRYQRTRETVLELKSNSTSNICLSAQVNISKNIRDFIEPINIFAKHDFVYDNSSREFCKFCPVERRDNKLQIAQALLSFNIGCGEDKICNSNVSATAKFHNVRYNDTWVIGSDDVSLEVNLKNHGEPAYLMTVEFTLPEGVVLRSILPSCQEDASKENLIVICDTGNPIWKDEKKNVRLNLDMRHLINGSVYDNKLYFRVTIKTRSINLGTTLLVKELNLVNEVSLSLHGKANEEAYYLTSLEEAAPNISFQHTYQVYKLGASPIHDAQLIVNVPLTIKGSETLVYVYKPQLYISGELFECFSEDTLLDTQLVELRADPSLDQFDMSMLSNKMQQNKTHTMEKRELEESYLWFYDVESIKAPNALNENRSSDVIYMNCSTTDVTCTTIMCDLDALKTLQDIGKMIIKLLLDVNKLKENFGNNGAVIQFATEARVKIIKPDVRLSINGTRSNVEIVTKFYDTPKVEKLQLWIVLVSVLVGLLLLIIFAVILSMMGFFKRKGKQDLMDLRTNEVTEGCNTAKSEDT